MNSSGPMTQIGKYRILSELGRGGMGVVYRAEDRFIGREVAIKTLTDTTPQMRERFNIEARSGVLNHPNIVTIYDFGEHDGNPYIVMEFLHGITLERVVKEQREMTLVEKLEVVRQVCEGLGHAHSRGVVHRDVKPANIVVLSNGCVKLVDFGIAQLESLSGHTVVGSVIGTYQYLSPERLKGEPSDARADIWSAGVVLYLLLTGTLPFPGEDISALHRVITDPYPPLGSMLSTAYPESLDNIVGRALAKNPEERYPTAMEMAGDLEATRDAIRLSRVEDLLGQARMLIDGNELLRARPLLLDLQRLAPQNTAVRTLLREVQDRLTRRAEVSRDQGPTAPDADAPVVSAEEERRQRIIAQIVLEIRAQSERGQLPRALELVKRSLERAPDSLPLQELQQQLVAMLAGIAEPSPSNQDVEAAVGPEPAFNIASHPLAPSVVEPAFATSPHAPSVEQPSGELSGGPTTSEANQHLFDAAAGTPDRDDSVDLVARSAERSPFVGAATGDSAVTLSSESAGTMSEVPTAASVEPGEARAEITPTLPVEPEGDRPEKEASLELDITSKREQVAAYTASTPPTPSGALDGSTILPAPVEVPKVSTAVARPFEVAPSPAPIATLAPAVAPVPLNSASPSVSVKAKNRPAWLFPTVAAVGLLLVAVMLFALLHRPSTPASPVFQPTFAEVVVSPAGRVISMQSEGGEAIQIPGNQPTSPLRLTGLKPGNYLVETAASDGRSSKMQCSIDAAHHLCFIQLAPLSNDDLSRILKGETAQ